MPSSSVLADHPTRVVSLDMPELAFRLDGEADLHGVLRDAAGGRGRRRHLLRLSGGAVFGLGSDDAGTLAFELTLRGDATLQSLVAGAAEQALLVDRWIAALAGAVRTLAGCGSGVAFAEDMAATPLGDLAWVQVVGEQMLPEHAIALQPGEEPTSVSQHAAFTDPTDDRAATADLLRDRRLAPAMAHYHRLVRRTIATRLAEGDAAELRRLAARTRREEFNLHDAFRHFRKMLVRSETPRSPIEGAAFEALFAAASEVADRLGVALQRPRRTEYSTPRETIGAISELARLRFRRVVLTGTWWRRDGGDMIAFLGRKPVALLVEKGRRILIVDPSDGVRRPLAEDDAKRMGRFAFSLFRTFPDRELNAWDVLRAGLHNQRGTLAVIGAAGLCGAILGLLTPLVSGAIFDDIIPAASTTQLRDYIGILLAAALGTASFGLTQAMSMLRLRGQSVTALQAAVWDRLLTLPTGFFRQHTAGDLANRALGINTISATLTGVSLGTTFSAVFSVFSFGLMVYYNWRLSIYGLATTLVPIAFGIAAMLLQARQTRPILDLQGKLTGVMFQLISGIAKLRVAGAERRAFLVWSRDYARQAQLQYLTRRRGWRLGVFTNVYNPAVTLLLFIIVAWQASSIHSGDFIAFNIAFQQFLGGVMGLVNAAGSSIGIVPTYQRARPILQATPEISASRLAPGVLRGAIDVQEVTFRYDSALVLDRISMSVASGEFVAICGMSGSGKSTLLRLLLGFEQPTSGLIAYDRKDLSNLDLRALRRQIGTVLQGSRLMPGTIYQNIVGNGAYTVAQAWHAAERAGLSEDILGMPMRMQTFVAEGAATFSGGQRQRLLLARAIVREPRILFLDEATSALDNRTQAIVARSLEAMRATRIVIAHRLSTVERADRIVVLDRGRLVEQGRYDDLIRSDGPFALLARRQLLKEDEWKRTRSTSGDGSALPATAPP